MFPYKKNIFAIPLFLLGGMHVYANKIYTAKLPESSIAYLLIHPMHKIKGVSHQMNCHVELNPDSSQGRITVDAEIKNFDSGNSNRDSHAMEMLDVYLYPKVEFASDSFKKTSLDHYNVTGTLTFHNVKKSIVFPIMAQKKAGQIEVDGELKILLTDYKIQKPTLMLIPTEDTLTISLHVVADTVGVQTKTQTASQTH